MQELPLSRSPPASLDVSMGALNAGFFNAQKEDLDLRAVAALGVQPGPVIATPLLARKDLWDSGAIKNGANLKGRKVAANTPGSIPEYLLTLILQKYGMASQRRRRDDARLPANARVAFKQPGCGRGVPGRAAW